MPATHPLLKPHQVATILNVDIATVYRHLHSKELPGIKVGRVWRIHPLDLDWYMQPDPRPPNPRRPPT